MYSYKTPWLKLSFSDSHANWILLFSQEGDDGDDDDVFDGGDRSGDVPGGDFTQAEFPMSQDTTFGDSSSQALSFTNESVVDQTLFTGDGLVAQPNKVLSYINLWTNQWTGHFPVPKTPTPKRGKVQTFLVKMIFAWD